MAAVEVLVTPASGIHSWPRHQLSHEARHDIGSKRFGTRLDRRESAHLNYALCLIAEAWVELRSSSRQHPNHRESSSPRPLIVPNFCTLTRRRDRYPASQSDESLPSTSSLSDPTATDVLAQRRCPDARDRDSLIDSCSSQSQSAHHDDGARDLFSDPAVDLIDWQSDDGVVQTAGKKKKKQTTTFNWLDDEGDKKDGDGADENKDQNGGDSGSGGGSGDANGTGGDDGDKKDDGNNADDANNDDLWDFTPVGSKKKNKNKASDTKAADEFGLPDIPSTDFHEIKLDDGGGGGGGEDSLDFGLGTKAEKITTGLTAWTSSWTTGSWGWGGLKSPGGHSPKPAEDEQASAPVEHNPWGLKSGNTKKTTTSGFTFGDLDQAGDTKDEPIDFLGSSKSKKEKDIGGFSWGVPTTKTTSNDFWGNLNSTDDQPKDEDKTASDDIWGFSSSKKDKKKKNKISIIDDIPAFDDSNIDPMPESQAGESPEDVERREAEAALVAEEEAELQKLQLKKDIGSKLTKKQQDRFRILTENAKARAEAAAAAAPAEPVSDDRPAPDSAEATDTPAAAEDPADGGFDAQAEADEKARIAQEEEDEMFILRSKKKLKKAEKDRLRQLEDNAEQRAREAVEAAASKTAEEPVPDLADSAETPADDPLADTIDAAQAEAEEQARIIQEEEEELAQLRGKKKPKKADKDRIRILEERAEDRAREAEEAAAALTAADDSLHEASGDNAGSKTDETAPTSIDDFLVDDGADQADKDEAARVAEEEELELELLLSKSKLKKADKVRLKELQDNKAQREQEQAEKLKAETPPEDTADASGPPPPDTEVLAGDTEAFPPKTEEDDLAAKIAEEEELELEVLLSKSKLKKADKARLKELQDNKAQRDEEAAARAEAAAAPGSGDDAAPPVEEVPAVEAEPVDEAALQKEAEAALIASEEDELSDLLNKSKLKKADKARLKELQDRKDKRDEEARAAAAQAEEEQRLAQEKADQEARELEEQQKREEEEKRAAEIAAEEEEISSLKSKKKLKRAEKDRLAELEFRRDERASAEAAKLAEELLKEDASNDQDKQADAQPLSWADDDPANENVAGDDWLDWGMSGSKKSKKKDKEDPVFDPVAVEPEKEDDAWSAWGTSKKDKKKKSKSSTLIDFVSAEEPPAVPDPPPAVPEVGGFDFGWGKQSSKATEAAADDIWSFGGSSKKKKSKDVPAEVVEDTMVASPIDEVKDQNGDDDFWSTFGTSKKSKAKKSSSKDDQVADFLPSGLDLTAGTGDEDGGDLLDDHKSRSSDKDSTKKSSKEPKLSKKELEKLEKEKKKAEKEQKAREEQEAKEAEKLEKEKRKAEKEQKAREEREAKELAEKARIEEEERLAAEAKAEEERLAQEEADRIRREEEEKQAALDAIAQEETDLAALQAKKDSGKKLTKKDKEKYDKLSVSCQARADEKAAQEAAEQAAREEAERLQREAEEQARKEAIEKEEAELKELQRKKDSGRKLLKKDKEKYELLAANKKARRQAEKDAEAARAEAAEANDVKVDDDIEKDLAKLDANELDELDKFLSEPVVPASTKKPGEVDPFSFWGASKKSTSSKKGKSSAFDATKDEPVPPPPPPAPADAIPPPPPPAPEPPVVEVKSKRKSKQIAEIPGSFPTEDEGHPDDIIEVIDMSPPKTKKSSKKSSKAKSADAPVPVPPPPPAVPDVPIPPPPEVVEVVKKDSKKERPKINRDGGSSWGMWTATTSRDKDKKSSSRSKPVEASKERKSRSPEKEEKLSSKGSSSDKAERAETKEKQKDAAARTKVASVFASTPPISRSLPTREKRHKEGRSSRRSSVNFDSGLISPPPEELPEVTSKAAKILGIGEGGLGRSSSKRKKRSRANEDDDVVVVGDGDMAPSPEKPSRRRSSKSQPRDDDIVMVDVADAIPTPPPVLRRSNTTGSTRKGLGGLFGGILSTPRSESRRRHASHTDGEDNAAATDAEVEARKAARRARRVEREVAEKPKDDARREKRRKEEEGEAQRQAEKAARRAERHAARARKEEEQRDSDDKDAAREERRRLKRAGRDKEREAVETGAEEAEAEARRAARRERRRARAAESGQEDEEERRRRRAEKRAAREAEGKPTPTRRRTEPVEDDFVYTRPGKMSRRHTEGVEKPSRRAAAEAAAWPHSGLTSWVQDHSDAGPPPEDGGMTTEAPDDDMVGDEDAARRERRRRRRYGDVDIEIAGERDRRHKRREERSDGSDERRRDRKGSLFADGPGSRSGSGGIGGFWKKLTGN